MAIYAKKTFTKEGYFETDISVLLLLCLVGTSTTNTAAFELPFLIEEAKAIIHKNYAIPSLPPHNLTSSNKDNAIVFNVK